MRRRWGPERQGPGLKPYLGLVAVCAGWGTFPQLCMSNQAPHSLASPACGGAGGAGSRSLPGCGSRCWWDIPPHPLSLAASCSRHLLRWPFKPGATASQPAPPLPGRHWAVPPSGGCARGGRGVSLTRTPPLSGDAWGAGGQWRPGSARRGRGRCGGGGGGCEAPAAGKGAGRGRSRGGAAVRAASLARRRLREAGGEGRGGVGGDGRASLLLRVRGPAGREEPPRGVLLRLRGPGRGLREVRAPRPQPRRAPGLLQHRLAA